MVTSSSSGQIPGVLFARCRHQERCLVAHPLNPPELVPLVEVIPGSHTEATWLIPPQGSLTALRRMPILLRKPVRRYVVVRIAAAVWRECVDLVLTGVIDVEALDQAVSLGPALGWAAAGPHLTYHLAAGEGGVKLFLQRLLASFEEWWSDLATWHQLDQEQQRALTAAIERAYRGQFTTVTELRDRRLAAMLEVLERSDGVEPT